MKVMLFALSLVSLNAFSATISYKCEHPELSGKPQKIILRVAPKNAKATLSINGKAVQECQNVPYVEAGVVDEYGEGTLTVKCKGNKLVVLENNYDEMYIDIGALKRNLGDDRYSCR